MPDSTLYYNNDLKVGCSWICGRGQHITELAVQPGGNDSVGRKAEWNGSSYQFKDDKKETSDLSLLPPGVYSNS
jgi:hypothetical protein